MVEHSMERGENRASLWFALWGGGIAWMFHLVSSYGASEWGCVGSMGRTQWAGASVVAWLEAAISLAALVLASMAAAIGFRDYRRRSDGPADAPESGLSDRFTARAGGIASGLFAFIILIESLPILFFLRRC